MALLHFLPMSHSSVFAPVFSKLKEILAKKNETANKEIYLPMELLVLILYRLPIKDNIHASLVCKTWHEAAVSVRDRYPWLVYFNIDQSGVSCGFFDPRKKKKTKAMKLNDLFINASICYSKDGWLLMEDHHDDTKVLFFFNPFTRECIKLPSLITTETEFAFSCAPTNKSCVVCGISHRTPDHFLIHTWYLGAFGWVTDKFDKPTPPSKGFREKNIVFLDGFFWFPYPDGLGVFNPTARTWNTLHVPLEDISLSRLWITEYKGNIFLLDVITSNGRILVFRLNRFLSVWERENTCDGFSIFISDASSIVTHELGEDIDNIVYMWFFHLNQGRPCKYSLCGRVFWKDPEGDSVDESSSTNNEMHHGAWIEPPKTSSIYHFPIIDPSFIDMQNKSSIFLKFQRSLLTKKTA